MSIEIPCMVVAPGLVPRRRSYEESTVSDKESHSTWAKLIARVYEVEPKAKQFNVVPRTGYCNRPCSD